MLRRRENRSDGRWLFRREPDQDDRGMIRHYLSKSSHPFSSPCRSTEVARKDLGVLFPNFFRHDRRLCVAGGLWCSLATAVQDTASHQPNSYGKDFHKSCPVQYGLTVSPTRSATPSAKARPALSSKTISLASPASFFQAAGDSDRSPTLARKDCILWNPAILELCLPPVQIAYRPGPESTANQLIHWMAAYRSMMFSRSQSTLQVRSSWGWLSLFHRLRHGLLSF